MQDGVDASIRTVLPCRADLELRAVRCRRPEARPVSISPVGFLVFAAIFLLGYCGRGPVIIGLITSFAFGATALMTLHSLGGSSPLIYSYFGATLLATVAIRPHIWRELGLVFGLIRPMWIICALILYAVVGSWLFPRLLAGQTTVFVQSREGMLEAPLGPVSGNISQTAYFVLGGLTAIALCVLLASRDRMSQIRLGFLLWAVLHSGMGLLDFVTKIAGMGDVLGPIRTASYAMLTETLVEGGFWRISGANSEASTFGGMSLACLAFLYAYWRRTKSRAVRNLAILVLVLLVLSTSSTAYVGLVILCVPVAISIGRSFVRGRLDHDELRIITLVAIAACLVLTISVFKAGLFDPVVELIDAMVINKSSSTSGRERAYWNIKSMQAFFDTGGFGVGLGSSRASSWPIAVISQLGLIGALLMATLLFVLLRGMGTLERYIDPETAAVVASVRASALAIVAAASLTGGSADPGMVFFIAIAVISSARATARRNRAFERTSGDEQGSIVVTPGPGMTAPI
jgi:hypothetical protein